MAPSSRRSTSQSAASTRLAATPRLRMSCVHPSVSRQHCILSTQRQARSSATISARPGTFINKQKIPPRTHVALRIGAGVDSGSRRVPHAHGGVDPARGRCCRRRRRAGAQTKEEAAEQRAKARAERIAQQTGRSKVSAEDLHARSDGAGWGFVDDAEVYAEADRGGQDEEGIPQGFEQLVATAKAQGLRLSSKQERLIEQLEKRTAKMLHLKQETERIAAKEVDGLSEGQQRQVERNTQRLTELTEQIDSLKDQISETIREQLSAGALGVVQKGRPRAARAGRWRRQRRHGRRRRQRLDRTERKNGCAARWWSQRSAAKSQWSAQMEAAAAAGRGSPNRRSHYAPSSRTPGQGGSR